MNEDANNHIVGCAATAPSPAGAPAAGTQNARFPGSSGRVHLDTGACLCLRSAAQAQCCSPIYRRRSCPKPAQAPVPRPALPQQRDAHGTAIPVCRHRGSCNAPGNKHNLLLPAGWLFTALNPLSLSGLSRRERLPLSRSCILQRFEKKRRMGLGTRFFSVSSWHVACLRLFVSNPL